MIISQCRAEGCKALTIGAYCVEHDLPVTRVFVRGRPFATSPTRSVSEGVKRIAPSRRVTTTTAVSA
jgi:hypothetical protein